MTGSSKEPEKSQKVETILTKLNQPTALIAPDERTELTPVDSSFLSVPPQSVSREPVPKQVSAKNPDKSRDQPIVTLKEFEYQSYFELKQFHLQQKFANVLNGSPLVKIADLESSMEVVQAMQVQRDIAECQSHIMVNQ